MRVQIALLILAMTSLWSSSALAARDLCGYRTLEAGTVFSLSIDRSFDSHVIFKICARKDPNKNFLLVIVDSKGKSKHHESRQVSLSADTYAKVLALYDKALEYNVKDDGAGTDGSVWCLETQRGFTYSKACFWTPDDKPKERGISGLLVLGQELWRLAAMGPSDGELY